MNSLAAPASVVRYDAMCNAIAAAYEVDEVKTIRDKALALEVYARQANNVEAERQACEIRLRAERRAGALIAERPKAKPGPAPVTSSDTRQLPEPPKLRDLGISYDQSSQWQKLAKVPEPEFEAALGAAEKPTTGGIIAEFNPPAPERERPPAVDPEALFLWGRLLDFERHGLLDRDPEELLTTMLPHMRDTLRDLAPRVAEWLRRFP